jgi:four helix bundle protein
MTLTLPKFELYEQGSQVRRSSKSIKDNIAEGFGRRRYKDEFVRFLVFAHSSCDEAISQLTMINELYFENNGLTSHYYDSRIDLGTASITTGSLAANISVYGGLKVFSWDGSTANPEVFRVQANGNVGIGTITPSSSLHIVSSSATLKIQQSISAAVFNGLELVDYLGGVDASYKLNQSSGEVRLFTGASYFPTFYSSNAEIMRITSAGNVGIRTTAPSASFHVAGTTLLSSSFNTLISGSTLSVNIKYFFSWLGKKNFSKDSIRSFTKM